MNLLLQNHERYLSDKKFLNVLGQHEICVLSDFLMNEQNIETFWNRYYGNQIPRVVICGINPGRFGAGMTGIPFIDYKSLAQMIPGVEQQDSEKSAGFIFEAIRRFGGADKFYRSFYVTDYSSVGYLSSGRNCNFYELPELALKTIKSNFLKEMELVSPTHVISLGKETQAAVQAALPQNVDCSLRLQHPSWISTYRSKETEKWLERYQAVLEPFRS